MRLAIVATAVLALAGTASAATLTVGPNGTHTTITLAAGDAADGDTIIITKGRYFENVTFSDPNLKIIGKGAIVDGNVAGVQADCFTITAAGVSVTGVTFRNGGDGIEASGGTLTVTKCNFIDTTNSGINVTAGDGLTVTGCKFYGVGSRAISAAANTVVVTKCWIRSTDSDAIDVTNSNNSRFEGNTILFVEDSNAIDVNTGNAAKVLKNKINNCDSNAIEITGNDAEVVGNTVVNCEDNTCIDVTGTSALIGKNKLTNCSAGIECYGNDAEVLGNKILDVHGYTGMEVEADNVTVIGNSVAIGSNDAYGFYIYSSTATGGGLIENNRASDMIDAGFYLGDSIYNCVVKNCSARNCGSEDEEGIYIGGNSNTCERLAVMNQDGPGIIVSGNNNTFTACSVKKVNSDGFRVSSGDNNDFNNCTATGCGSDGFDNRGTNTGLSGGKYVGERFDVVNDFGGGATMTLLNVNYTTGGTTQANEDD